MAGVGGLDGLLAAVRQHPSLGEEWVHHEVLEARPAEGGGSLSPAFEGVAPALASHGIDGLYSHQARALELVEAGRDVVLATPTASGKTLVYNVPALARALADPEARALYLFPLRALEQDQHKRLLEDIAALPRRPGSPPPRVEVYDGDTSTARRKQIRTDPPQILISTPDMLHAGILPNHGTWKQFFRGLRLVVVDELHSYRGVFGGHIAQVLRRLDRVARHHGAQLQWVGASATVANPGELATNLVGRPFEVVQRDGAPKPERHVALFNPRGSPYTTAARLFRLSVEQGLRTIAFTKARTITELMYTWVIEAAPRLRNVVSPYRAGFLAEERREIEQRLFRGDLLGVISTSALEMGIDVGGLDVCLLVGYPGSQTATWQRSGRVGRNHEALIALVAGADALDQYLVAHPKVFLAGRFEHAVLDPHNPEIAGAHLPCAAAEVPLRAGEAWLAEPGLAPVLETLENRGALLRSETGREWFAARRRPHRLVDLRGAGTSYSIVQAEPEREGMRARTIGSIGSGRVLAECHEGAIYLHRGRQFLVTDLDLEERRVSVRAVDVPHYTRAVSEKETEILSRERSRPAGNFRLLEGRVKVTTTITGFERRRVHGQELLSTEPLELPPSHFETVALWLEMPDEIPEAVKAEDGHFMGGIHAVEHAALALFPLFALCDRHDVAGISYKLHPQLGRPAIFLYDSSPGGIGIASSLFDRVESLLESTLEMVRDCACENGCPACVHSPKCGSGNRPIDKAAAVRTLELLLGRVPLPRLEEPPVPRSRLEPAPPAPEPEPSAPDVVFFDLETQRSAADVGGWHNAHLMRVSVAVLWEARHGRFRRYREREVPGLLSRLGEAELVVGFNVNRFDYQVLRGYTDDDLTRLPTFDLLDAIHHRLGYRLSLGHLGEETLGRNKSADGLAALAWWKEGRLDEIEAYCEKDVALLRDLFEHAREHGHLLFRTRRGDRVRIPMRLSLGEILETTCRNVPDAAPESGSDTAGAGPSVQGGAGANP